MSNLKPGDNTGTNGGIYQEVDQHGHSIENFVTAKDHEKLLQPSMQGIYGN